MKKASLKGQIIKFGMVSFILTGLFTFATYFLNLFLNVRQSVNYEGDRLIASAPTQADQLLPAILLPEEYGSIDLQLQKIIKAENLTAAKLIRPPNDSISTLLKCSKISEQTRICSDYFQRQVTTVTGVGLPGKTVGYLVKHKRLPNLHQDNFVMPSLGLLFLGITFVFLGLILSILIFIDEHLRKPLLNISQSLTPVLDGEFGSQLPSFFIEELRALAIQITQLVRNYEERKAADVTSQLATQVAHDIRSPLAALEVTVSDVSQLPEDKRILIRSAVSRIRDIANNLIDKNRELETTARTISELDKDYTSVEPESVQLLSSLMDPLISEKRLQYRSRIGIEIYGKLNAESYGLFAQIQPTEFKRVLSNLINNSIEAMGDKGRVTVYLSSVEGSVLLAVRDNGRGIAPEILAKLGRRGESHGKVGGTGLGLHHAKTCIESWGGVLEIESAVGKGTTVRLKLPQSPAPDWFVSELVLDPERTVIILDDDTSIHQIWQARLNDLRTKGHDIKALHFSIPQELRNWVRENHLGRSQSALYLLDYELLGYQETGLSLAEDLGIGERTFLVTSRYEEPGILEGCQKLKVRMIPKGLAGLVPIRIANIRNTTSALTPKPQERWDAILIDDDPLVQMTWKMMASRTGKRFHGFTSITDFLAYSQNTDRDTPIYVDVKLGDDVRGDKESLKIAQIGFKNIYLATGHDAEKFAELKHVHGVVGKSPPWTEDKVAT